MDKTNNEFKIDWILINELAIGSVPSKPAHIKKLINYGFKGIFSLCNPIEYKYPEGIEQHLKLFSYELPDHKSLRAPSLEELNLAINKLRDSKKYGPIYMHCFAGVERSPLVAMAWMMKEYSMDAQSSLEYVMQQHPGTNPLKEQFNLLQNINS
tara:strand:- start:488 stop:949 length:462 start_codon:yes stop_codon:yes gene_type:complete